jgi:hypothetical protein
MPETCTLCEKRVTFYTRLQTRTGMNVVCGECYDNLIVHKSFYNEDKRCRTCEIQIKDADDIYEGYCKICYGVTRHWSHKEVTSWMNRIKRRK